jgi:large subunit ribosomal protein L4e
MATRPLVGVYNGDANAKKAESHVKLPTVFEVQIRPDLVKDVFARMNKNRRQAYAVSRKAGHQTSAESWGTGRAVARIPRVPGGGTHRAGQGAFGNMCRGGRMFAPTRIWRRWHRKINITQKRFALASAVSASAVPSLVLARGHRIDEVAEVPLVVDNKAISAITKTKQAKTLLKSLKALADVEKVEHSRKLRCGVGKSRNRRYVQRRGPLIVYNETSPLTRAFRNLPGVELANVHRLNLLQLAPGGHLGRFVIWTQDAFDQLNKVFGTFKTPSAEKHHYKLPRGIVANADLSKVINSEEIQSVLRNKKHTLAFYPKRNPLKNMAAMNRLNPAAVAQRRASITKSLQQSQAKAALIESKRTGKKVEKTKVQQSQAAKAKVTRKQISKARSAFKKQLLTK